jgi:putative phage-type endonuclease
MDSQTWEERKKCITGTDIAAICGISKWASPLSVFLEKTGLNGPIEDNRYMEWGRRLEPIVAKKYSDEKAVALEPGGFFRKGIFGGTVDFLAPDRIVEIKTTSFRGTQDWGEAGSDQIPDYYQTQVQWYMALHDMDLADVAVLIGGNDYRVYCCKRNRHLVGLLQDKANHFWENFVVKEVMPPASSRIDQNIVSRLFESHGAAILERPYLDEHARRLAELKDKQSKNEDEIDKIEAIIKGEIGENAGVKSKFWSATWKKISDSKKTDWKSLVEEINPSKELIEKHTKAITGYRRFTFKSNF